MEHKNREDDNISTLTDERLERLQSIGFRWAKRRGQVRWDEKYVSQCQKTGESDPHLLMMTNILTVLPSSNNFTHRMNSFNMQPSLAIAMSLPSTKKTLLLGDGYQHNALNTNCFAKEKSLQ